MAAGRFLVALGSTESPPIGAKWGATRLWLPPGREDGSFRDVLTGEVLSSERGSLALSRVFAELPVALLESMA